VLAVWLIAKAGSHNTGSVFTLHYATIKGYKGFSGIAAGSIYIILASAGFERSFAEAGYQVYNAMNGPSEFTVTGTLKTWDSMDRLPEIQVPTLLVGGRYDQWTPGHLAEMHRRIAGSRLEIIEDASHLCFAEQPAAFNDLLDSFLAERAGTS
jgi:pimeloyl-ACP methyl ester carboxylesterase